MRFPHHRFPVPPRSIRFLAGILAMLFVQSGGFSAEPAAKLPPPHKEKFQLGPWEDDIGYVQAVRVGNTLYISGSVGAGEMPAAIKSAYDEIGQTLAAYQLTFAHVVKENVFTTQLDELIKHKAVRRAYYGTDFPTASWVQVSRLYDPKFVIEVEVVAVFPDGH